MLNRGPLAEFIHTRMKSVDKEVWSQSKAFFGRVEVFLIDVCRCAIQRQAEKSAYRHTPLAVTQHTSRCHISTGSSLCYHSTTSICLSEFHETNEVFAVDSVKWQCDCEVMSSVRRSRNARRPVEQAVIKYCSDIPSSNRSFYREAWLNCNM